MSTKKHLIIKNIAGIYNVLPDEISHINALGPCSSIIKTNGEKITYSKNLITIEKELAELKVEKNFYRSHHSHIVSLKNVSHYDKKSKKIVLHNGEKIKLARRRKAEFEDKFDKI